MSDKSEKEPDNSDLYEFLRNLNLNSQAILSDQSIRGRLASAISGGYDFADTMHSIFIDFGYPDQISFHNLWNMYRRLGVARNVVELPIEFCWSTLPTITGSDKFNSEFKSLAKRIRFFNRCKSVDRRQRVGRYGGFFMRVRDGKKPSEPLEGSLPGPSALVSMTPLYESQMQVLETDHDPNSDRFDQPVMYHYNQSVPGNRNEKGTQAISIHHTRVIPISEYADDGSIYGLPILESVFNSLMDLRKIIGGSAEGFYKNASQSIVFNLKEAASAIGNDELLEKFNEKADDFMRNRMRRSLWTPGMDAKALSSTLASSKDHFNAALNDVAAGSKIAATILIGQQTGRLASTEDSKSFLGYCQSRRINFIDDGILDRVLEWFFLNGILPFSEYSVEWDDLLEQSSSDKLTSSKSMSDVNVNQFRSGGDSVFSAAEIRVAGGYESVTDTSVEEEISEDLGDDPIVDI